MNYEVFVEYRKTLEDKSEHELIDLYRGTDDKDVKLAIHLELNRREKCAQHSVHPTGGMRHAPWCASRNDDMCDCGGWQPASG